MAMAYHAKEMMEEQELISRENEQEVETGEVEFGEVENENRYMSQKRYASNVGGAYIVNAVSGYPYPYRVGSIDEHRLWKVVDSTGYDGSRDAQFYFYDSPLECGRHMGYKVPAREVEKWRNRVEKLSPDVTSDDS